MARSRLILVLLFVCFGYSAFSQINGKHVPMPKDGVLDTLLFNDTTNVLTAITTVGDTFEVVIPDSTGTVDVSIAGVNIQVTENSPNDFTITDTSATFFYVDSLFATLSSGADGTINTVSFDNPTRILTITTTEPDTFTTNIPDSVNPFQVLSWVEATRTLTLANGGSVVIADAVDDADSDPNNELQDLGHSVNGTDRTITITNGSNTTFSIADNDNDSGNEYNTNVNLNGSTLEITDGGGTLSQDLSPLAGGNTIYTGNGSLSGSRTVTVGTNDLSFDGTNGEIRHSISSVHGGLNSPGVGLTSASGVVGVAGAESKVWQTANGGSGLSVTSSGALLSAQGNSSSLSLSKTGALGQFIGYASNMRLNDAQIPPNLPSSAGNWVWQIDGITGGGTWAIAPQPVTAGNGILDNAGTFNLGGNLTSNITWFGSGAQVSWSGIAQWTASVGGNSLQVTGSNVILNGLNLPPHSAAGQGLYYYNGSTFTALPAPGSGTHTLKSVGGVIQWVAD